MRISRVAVLVLAVALAVWATAAEAFGQCSACNGSGDWAETDPFGFWQDGWNPDTLGLPVGAEAPEIAGIQLTGNRTVVVVADSSLDPDIPPVVEDWGEIASLQVILVLSRRRGSALQEVVEQVGPHVTVVAGVNAAVACAQYRVSQYTSCAMFLVDELGAIVYRHRRLSSRNALVQDRLVRQFAECNVPDEEYPEQLVLWYGDKVLLPCNLLETVSGESFPLDLGCPRLFFLGFPVEGGQSGLVLDDLEMLRGEYPEVEFVWLHTYFSEERLADMWEFARRAGLERTYPALYDVTLEDYLERANEGNKRSLTELEDFVMANADGWTVLLDRDQELLWTWQLVGWPSVMIVDGDGTVLFPSTFYPTSIHTGEWQVHPEAINVLRGILDQAVGR